MKKYCLVANGVISDKHNVTLGVPQGLVLASLVFIIMVAVIGENMIISKANNILMTQMYIPK